MPERLTASAPRSCEPPALDRPSHAAVGRWTAGLSPAALAVAGMDRRLHLATSPSKQVELAAREVARPATAGPDGAADEADPRFRDPTWRARPHAALADAVLARQRWWEAATTGVSGLDPHNADVVRFTARQALDAMCPADGLATDPMVARRTIREGGADLLRGAVH
jgi:polyhydroxyalkanoate synthase